MLGNDADAFMRTPMVTHITTQASRAAAREMPMPRPTAMVNDEMMPGMGDVQMLPGMGDPDMLPGMGNAEMLPGMGALNPTDPKTLGLLAVGGLAIWWFFIR
jgi:hypothetical protein